MWLQAARTRGLRRDPQVALPRRLLHDAADGRVHDEPRRRRPLLPLRTPALALGPLTSPRPSACRPASTPTSTPRTRSSAPSPLMPRGDGAAGGHGGRGRRHRHRRRRSRGRGRRGRAGVLLDGHGLQPRRPRYRASSSPRSTGSSSGRTCWTGMTLFDAPMAFTGASLKWFRDKFADPESALAERMGQQRLRPRHRSGRADQRRAPTACCTCPYLGNSLSPRWNDDRVRRLLRDAAVHQPRPLHQGPDRGRRLRPLLQRPHR